MIVRHIKATDSEDFTSLSRRVESGSDYMLWEDGERKVNPDDQRHRIEGIENSRNSTILVAENNDELVGYLIAIGGSARRNKHSVYLVIGILQEYRGQGIGTRLFEEIESWASKQKIHRLELTVVTRNESALALYKKSGFEVEGVKRDSLLIDGEFVDEYYMSKLL